ncbi:MAG: uncharacterized protein PWQ91_880 [Eubacteriales bacterium]|nr:uncharacterized protein [Eubacteriales bacterium]MDN5363819.1 uncharacterized protein [Eubacteriales bacterium]
MSAETPLSWGGKRYHSFNYHLQKTFGTKVFKVSLDAGFTCPNRDGTVGTGGCIFCSPRGSGDCAGPRELPLAEQFNLGRERISRKWPRAKYIAYFQAFTNTYAPVEVLREKYESVLHLPGVVGVSVGTRPDCLPPPVLDLLEEMHHRTYFWVELGLQTIHDRTAVLINRGYPYEVFLQAIAELKKRGLRTCVHIILGLPGESREDMLATGRELARLRPEGVKIHLLHLIEGTPLVKWYEEGRLRLLEMDEYVNLVVDILEMLPPETIIHRLTGDSPWDKLVGPLWSRKKFEILNAIERELEARNSWQGKKYPEITSIFSGGGS